VTVFFRVVGPLAWPHARENGMTVTTARPGRRIVRLRGSLDFGAAKELRERLIDVLHRGANPLIIDLSRVPSGDEAGLAVLIGTQRRARLLGSVVLLAAPSAPVAELLRSTGLHRHFTIYPDIAAALAHAPSPAAGQGEASFPELAVG
jgi:anti-anti-sigma factor